MANPVCDILLTSESLVSPRDETIIETGALVDFWGIVRALEDGRALDAIRYEAYTAMAEHQLRAIADEAAARFPLHSLTIHHRVGIVPVGEASLLVRVGSGHRLEAFAAAQWIVDELKRRVPIWKTPIFASSPSREMADVAP